VAKALASLPAGPELNTQPSRCCKRGENSEPANDLTGSGPHCGKLAGGLRGQWLGWQSRPVNAFSKSPPQCLVTPNRVRGGESLPNNLYSLRSLVRSIPALVLRVPDCRSATQGLYLTLEWTSAYSQDCGIALTAYGWFSGRRMKKSL
jgi:hypothetical protein